MRVCIRRIVGGIAAPHDLSTETGIRHGLFELAPEQLVLEFEGVST
jgi:hypothetical protein